MKQNSTFTFILTPLVLLTIFTAIFISSPQAAAAQAMPTATPVPLVTPVTSAGINMNGAGAMACPMMNSTAGMTTTGGTTGASSGMGSMMTTNMQGMNMSGMSSMSGMSNMDDRYVILSDPSTWFAANPWILIGWVILILVLLTLLSAFGLGIFYLSRRIALNLPTKKG